VRPRTSVPNFDIDRASPGCRNYIFHKWIITSCLSLFTDIYKDVFFKILSSSGRFVLMNNLPPPPPPGPPPPIHPSALLFQQGIASKYLGGKPVWSYTVCPWTDKFLVVSGRTSGESVLPSSIWVLLLSDFAFIFYSSSSMTTSFRSATRWSWFGKLGGRFQKSFFLCYDMGYLALS
jgi:hypothetical protein